MTKFERMFPDDFIEAVKQAGQALTKNLWAIGDFTIEARVKLLEKKTDIVTGHFDGLEADALMILAYTPGKLMRDLSRAFGLSRARLYQILDVVEFFAEFEGAREKFKILPFSHFELARSKGPKHAWSILQFDLAETERGQGSPPSVEWVYTNFVQPKIEAAVADHQAVSDFDNAAVAFISQPHQPDHPDEGLSFPVFYFLQTAKSLVESVSGSLDRFELDEGLRAEISRVLADLTNLSERLETGFKV